MAIGIRIKRAMEAAGKLPVDIAKHLNITESAVSQWFAKDSGPKNVRLANLAAFLDTTVGWLMSATDAPPGTPAAQATDVLFPDGRPDLPVWASAEAGDDGAMILTSEPIDHIHRRGQTRGAFAFFVIGGSMSPAIDHGNQVVVDPAQPPRAGDDCVFVADDGNGTMLALVKRLLRAHPDRWRVRQFEPLRDFDLPRKKWAKAFKITEKRYS